MGGGGDYQNKWEEILEGAGFTFSFLISNQYFCKKTTTIKRKTNYIKEV